MGRTGRALALALLAVLSLGNGGRGLFETSEGRYGSIAAEMSRSGDWIVPRSPVPWVGLVLIGLAALMLIEAIRILTSLGQPPAAKAEAVPA